MTLYFPTDETIVVLLTGADCVYLVPDDADVILAVGLDATPSA